MNINKELLSMVTVVSTPPPPNLYESLRAAFGPSVDFNKGTVFTYGQTIYAKEMPDTPLMEHEKIHVIQQMTFPGGPDAWWAKYLSDTDFRLNQEIEAYSVQYYTAASMTKDRNRLFKYLHSLATTLSSDMYGGLLSTKEAMNAIKK